MRVVAMARLACCARSSRCSWLRNNDYISTAPQIIFIYLRGCRTGDLLIDLDAAGGNTRYYAALLFRSTVP